MSTTVATRETGSTVRTHSERRREDTRTDRLTFPRVVRSEWIKLRSLRSTWTTLASIFAVIALFGLLAAAMASGSVDTQQQGPTFSDGDPIDTVLSGANPALLIIAVFGALVGAREYSSGLIRVTIAAVPARLSMLWAKIISLVMVLVPTVLAGVLIAFFAGMQVLSSAGQPTVAWSDPGVARAVLGNVAYLTGIGVTGVVLGIMLRSIASSIGVLIGGLLFLPTLATALLPSDWDTVLKYLPANAGTSFTILTPRTDLLDVTSGALVFTAWVVAGLIGAALSLRSRDA